MRRLFTIFILIGIFTPLLHAQSMESSEYRLEVEDSLNAPEDTDEIIPLEQLEKTPTPTPAPQSLFDKQGYIIKTTYTGNPFSFTLHNSTISFDSLTEKTSQTRALRFSLPNQPYGHTVLVKQTEPMKTFAKKEIKPTICSITETPCSIKLAKPWEEKDIYGFGYGLKGKTIPFDFMNASYYRPFSDKEFVPIVSTIQGNQAHETELTLKLQIQETEKESSFQGTIHLIAFPAL